jgi:hypothetical protein
MSGYLPAFAEFPAFAELEDRLNHDGIEADTRAIASVILGLATANEWTKCPEAFGDWLEQLALDMIRLRNPRLVKAEPS